MPGRGRRCSCARDGGQSPEATTSHWRARLTREPTEPVRYAALQPRPELLATIAAYLDERRVLGTRLVIEPPAYRWIRAVATVRLGPLADPDRVTQQALGALYRYLHPLHGGPEGSGWPFGRDVQAGELLGAVQRVPGVEVVEELKLYLVDPVSSQPSEGARLKVEMGPGTLPFSLEHVVELVSS
jgi:predicted phage baseplate assembly protein